MGSQEKSFKLHIYDIDEKWSFSYKSCFFYHSYILSLQNNTPEYSTIEKTNDSLNGGQVLVNFGGDCSNSQENSPSDSKHNLYDDENGVYNSLFEIQENTVKTAINCTITCVNLILLTMTFISLKNAREKWKMLNIHV